MTRYVAGFYFTPAGLDIYAVLLIQKKRGPHNMAGKWNAIGGKIEAGEAPADAMAREFHEEAGITIPATRWSRFCTLEGDGYAVDFFTAISTPDDAEPRTVTDETVDWWMPRSLPSESMDNLHWLLPMADERQKRDWPFHIKERA